MQIGYNIYSYFINLKDTSVKFIMPNTFHHLTIKLHILNIQLLCNQASIIDRYPSGSPSVIVNILKNCIFVGKVGFEPTQTFRFPHPKCGASQPVAPLPHIGAQFLYTVYRAPPTVVFNELVARVGVEPTKSSF